MPKKLIALDGDGVVFDYRKAFPGVWRAAFGTDIELIRPDAYHAHTAYGITWESPEQESHFFKHFGEEAWSTMPLFDGVTEACEMLASAGYDLICVTSMNPQFAAARQRNCDVYGLPITKVHAVKRSGSGNPKREVIERLCPLALVDDLMDNFEELPPEVHTAYIDYARFDAPSLTSKIVPQSCHGSLLDFARYWLAR